MTGPVFIAVDLETTGLTPGHDRITEVALVRFSEDGVQATFSTLVNPGVPIPPAVQRLTGIRDDDVAGAPYIDSVRLDLEAWLAGATVVGQSVGFDLAFLAEAGVAAPAGSIDTLDLAAILEPTAPGYDLGSLAKRFGIAVSTQHRALADAETTRRVFLAQITRLREWPAATVSALLAAGGAEWRLGAFLREITGVEAGALLRPAAPLARDEASVRTELERPRLRPPPVEVGGALTDESAAAEQALAVLRAGAAQGETFGAWEDRPEQAGMTGAVAQALAAGEPLLVEAGTGTGKSLAYLIPASLYALARGERVVISTNTITLQEQLLNQDVPALRSLLATAVGADAASALRAAPLKGRGNYACRRRVAQEQTGIDKSAAESRFLARLAVWMAESEWGDRAELRLLPDEHALWARINAEGQDCLSSGCVYVRNGSCFLLRARQRAEAAHLVVVNHALLLSDMAQGGSAIPAHDVCVIDEAHHLEDAATQHLGRRFTAATLTEVLERTARSGPRGAPAGLAGALAGLSRGNPAGAALQAAATALTESAANAVRTADGFFQAVQTLVLDQAEDAYAGTQRLRVTSGLRAQPDWSRLEMEWEGTGRALRTAEGALAAAESALAEGAGDISAEQAADAEDAAAEALALRGLLSGRAAELGEAITRGRRETVTWLSVEGRSGVVSVNTAPLQVDGPLREGLFQRKRSVVLTGATLTADGAFDYLRRTLGIDDAREAQFGSPFDYRRAARLLVPTNMPEPGQPGYQRALQSTLIELALASEGRGLVLLTSHSAVQSTAAAIRAPLAQAGIRVLAQGPDGSPARVMEALLADPRSLVLGTASLWEGVDVPGPAVSLVVIGRLPFGVPTDPVSAARSELSDDPFWEVALPQAVVRFRQGAGRLVRRRDDRGVVAVLDGRISSRAYGEVFIRSLPPMSIERAPIQEFGRLTAAWLAPATEAP